MMRTTSEICKMFDIDRNYLMRLKKGLLPPSAIDSSGLKTALYDDAAVERLWLIILLHKELDYKLKDVGKILDDPNFDRLKCLGDQIELLQAKAEHLNDVINIAETMRTSGYKPQDFMDTSKPVPKSVKKFSQNFENGNIKKNTSLYNLFGDKEFNVLIKKIISFKKKGLIAESDEIQTDYYRTPPNQVS